MASRADDSHSSIAAHVRGNDACAPDQIHSRLVALAAHDLRNPLASILGFCDMFLAGVSGEATEQQRHFVTMIRSAGQGMLELVNDMDDVAALEAGELRMALQPCDLAGVVRERVAAWSERYAERDMELALDAPERLDLMADPQRLGQVVDNFLSNALKYAPAGSRVDVLVEREDGRAAVRVRDQGPGIAEQDRAMLFGLFQRLSAKPAPGARSRGLGLAVCRRIMQAHGGDIGMESGPGPGARFYLALPLGGGE